MRIPLRIPLVIRHEPLAPGAFARRVVQSNGGPLRALSIRTVQVNVGLRCMLSCRHCHVQSSPRRKEQMSWEIMRLAVKAATKVKAATLDITGGEPEMHPQFRRLVEIARGAELQVIVRTNLAILLRPEHQRLPAFFKKHHVRLVGSLPSFIEEIVDRQRGRGVYRQSVEAIKKLNAVGYGIDPTLPLDIVYNPPGASLPRRQADVERDFKREFDHRYGIRFTQLCAVANMPVGRFQTELDRQEKTDGYMRLLQDGFNPDTLEGLMCRHQLHVAWDGTLYDCDFNCGLELPVSEKTPPNIRDFDATTYLQRHISNGEHCFGCTAGCGSSWGGALI
jgi:radical SAM/Cys-rich protein